MHFNRNRFLIRGKFIFNKYPENYYGIGNHTEEEEKNLITYHVVKFEGAVMKRIFKDIYAGPKVYFSDYFDVSGEKELSGVNGASGGRTVGVGAGVVYDSRDDLMAPEKGFYADISLVKNDRAFGSQFTYTMAEADLRKYFPISSATILAFQGFAQLKTGDLPFLQLSYLGGSSMMRGLYAGRFRDNNLLAVQVELRQRLSRQWGVVFFAGAGEVMPSFSQYSLDDLHSSIGGGFRRRLSKTERVNLRIDVGVANGKPNFYVNISEAF